MADFSQNISNVVNCFGGGPSTKWGQGIFPYTMTWGVSKWGQGNTTSDAPNSLMLRVYKVIGESISADPSVVAGVTYFRTITNTFTPEPDLGSRFLYDGSLDYKYVFPSNVDDADSQTIPSWSSQSASTATFTCQVAGSTTWS